MYVPGRNPLVEAVRSKTRINRIYIQEAINQDSKLEEILNYAREKKIDVVEVGRKKLETLSMGEPHQGIVGDLEIKPSNLTDKGIAANPGLYVYIREAQYEHNLGAIIRTAEAAGAKGVIIPPKMEVTPVVVRISMGAIFHIPVYSYSLFPAIKLFKKEGFLIAGIEINGEQSIYEANLAGAVLLIVGGEDKSISQEVANKCDTVMNIPQFGHVNSLNMSVAAGLAIFEYVRQNH